MKRGITCTVQKEDAGRLLKHFLKTPMGLSEKEIRRAKFREDGLRVNGQRRKTNALLREGDRIEVLLETGEETSSRLSASRFPLEILYEDADLLAVNKPSGLKTHPNGRDGEDTLANRLAAYLREKGEDSVIRIAGRLDRDTSGAVLAVKNRAAGARLARQRERGDFFKTYLAIVKGVPREPSGWIREPIGPDPERKGRMRISPHGKKAATWYEAVKGFREDCSLVRLQIETGRTHQIRVHMASLGYPLLGDPLYGEKAQDGDMPAGQKELPPIGRTALHAAELVFLQPFTGEKIAVKALVPEDMRELLLLLNTQIYLPDPVSLC